jgi:hypothetical protein
VGWYRNGGAIYNEGSSIVLAQCLFAGNFAGQGGGLFNTAASTAKLFDCTFAWNDGGTGRGIYNQSSSTTATNCVFWGPSSFIPEVYAVSGTLNVTYSDVRGGLNGSGNITTDPGFSRNPDPGKDGAWGTADDDYGDLRLRGDSPCIDAGTNSALPAEIAADLLGNPRIVDVPNVHDFVEIVDMGAYERTVPVVYIFDAPKPSLRFAFDVDLNSSTLDVGDLTLFNVTTQTSVNFSGSATVSYDPASRSATWLFSIPLPDGDYRATIAASNVADTTGSSLAADAVGNFFVFAGDCSRDRKVDINDLAILAMNWQGSGRVFSQGDFNYDGKVDAKDLGILSANWQKNLPAPAGPGQPVGVAPTAPRRTATRVAALVL